jgi:hypothetical protein
MSERLRKIILVLVLVSSLFLAGISIALICLSQNVMHTLMGIGYLILSIVSFSYGLYRFNALRKGNE